MRHSSRYPSDTSVAEWALIEPLLPVPACRTKTGGHPEKWPRRDIVDAIRFIVDNGAKWRALPAGFPPWQTVYGFFWRWNRAGVVTCIRDQLRRQIRTDKGRCPFPVTLIVDSQSVNAASTVGEDSRGYDAGKKINGRKRHIVVDTLGLPVMITVTPGDARPAMRSWPGTCSGASGSRTRRSPKSGRTPPTPATCCPPGPRTICG